jgi:hypothetical protein
MTNRWAGSRIAAIAAAVLLAGSLAAATAHGTESRPKAAGRLVHAQDTSKVFSRAEFSRPTASQYQPPPVNARDYQYCLTVPNGPPQPFATYISGYGNTEKQDGSAAVGYPDAALAEGGIPGNFPIVTTPWGEALTCDVGTVNLNYDGKPELPPMTATFRAFGFMPVTATVTLKQVGSTPITVVLYSDLGEATNPYDEGDIPLTVVSTGRFTLQLSDVKVNGLALNVGSSCQTTGVVTTPDEPVGSGEMALIGGGFPGDPTPWFAELETGGALAGLLDIPPLTGCETPSGENLDAVLTSAVSGQGNYVQVVQSGPCIVGLGAGCNADDLPNYSPALYQVSNGGDYSASGPITIGATAGSPAQITCATSSISGDFPDVYGPLRGAFATMQWNLDDCTSPSASGTQTIQWSVREIGVSEFAGSALCDTQSIGICQKAALLNRMIGTIDNMSFVFTEDGDGNCQVDLNGWEVVFYEAGGGGTLRLGPSNDIDMVATNSTCGDYFPDSLSSDSDYGFLGIDVLSPSDITITPLTQ